MSRSRLIRVAGVSLGIGAVAAILAIGLSQTHAGEGSLPSQAPSAAAIRTAFAGSPAPLAALHAQANRLLADTPSSAKAQLAGLRGHAVVINKWASWCGPCRAEFPLFQRVALGFGRSVAFIGLNSGDSASNATDFLRRYPVTYPSFEDPDERIASALGAANYYPMTLFFDRSGRLASVHDGAYPSQALLTQDVRRYALGTASGPGAA